MVVSKKSNGYIEVKSAHKEDFKAEMNRHTKMAGKAAGSSAQRGSVKAKLIMIGVVVLVFIIAITALIIAVNESKKPKGPGPQQVDTVSNLEKVVKNSSLSTYEVVYNGVATVYNDKKPEDIDYHVAYTATVNAGFDLKSIKITKDDEKHEIVVSLPPIEIYEPKVNIEDLDYIVVGKKVKQETLSADAYSKSIADVDKKAKAQGEIVLYAKENGERLIKGLLMPFVDKLEEKYTIRFEWRDAK